MNKFVSIACVAMMLLAVQAQAVVIGDWESDSLEGWDGNNNGTLTTGATVGVTLGSNSLKVTDDGSEGWIQSLRWQAGLNADKAAFMANSILEFDISVAAASSYDPAITAGYSKLVKINMNNGSAGWQTVGDYTDDSVLFYWWDSAGERTLHVALDYSAYRDQITDVNPDGSGGGYIQIIFETQTGGGAPPELFYDNVQLLVPEPATMALLGLGALVLVRQKK